VPIFPPIVIPPNTLQTPKGVEMEEVPAETEDEETLKRNVDHLEALKNRIKMNGNVSLWTTEDFSTHDAAIAAGKAKY